MIDIEDFLIIKKECKKRTCSSCLLAEDDRPCLFKCKPRDWSLDEIQIVLEMLYDLRKDEKYDGRIQN